MPDFKEQFDTLPYVDQHWLRPRLRDLDRKERRNEPCDRLLKSIEQRLERAKSVLAERQAHQLQIQYPQQLPVSAYAKQVIELLARQQVVVLAGHTGSGKTTQIPKMCLQAGLGIKGQIAHTQPRRLAAVTVAERLAQECQQEIGQAIAYQVRFDKQVGQHNRIKLLTDGVLLNEIQNDPQLLRYDCIIIDEAHERSLNIDFLLGYLKRLLLKRPELRVIVTSATIDTQRFSQFFDDAPVIEVSGTLFPVEVRYRDDKYYKLDIYTPQHEHIAKAVSELFQQECPSGPADVLVFVATEQMIHDACGYMRGFFKSGEDKSVEILPLYARQAIKDQKRIFQRGKGGARRIIVATNIAETSLTVPGIRYVVDTGEARLSRYSFRSKIQQLPIEAVSQASADQRKGRCGRLSEGICIRLYSEQDFQDRPEFSEPEILRTNLASVILRLYSLKISDIDGFDFVDRPDPRLLRDGMRLLEEVQALKSPGHLSPIGWKLTRLPLDPRLGRLLLAGEQQNCLREMLILAAALSVQDPRERPSGLREQADKAHAAFDDSRSDFMSLLTLWAHVDKLSKQHKEGKWRQALKRDFINAQRAMDWRDVQRQLRSLCEDLGIKPSQGKASYAAIHKALLTGLLTHVGERDEKKRYKGLRQRQFRIFPGSGLAKKSPQWIVAAELVETREVFARTVAAIQLPWILQAAKHLSQRSYNDPYFDVKKAAVMAYERTSLYGLVLTEKRPVVYIDINPIHAREIYIREALVLGRSQQLPAVFQKNQQHQRAARTIATKVRRPGILIDEEVLEAHYNQLLPENVASNKSLAHWLRGAGVKQQDALELSCDALLQEDSVQGLASDYPDTLDYQGNHFALEYVFDPSNKRDGIVVNVPQPLLSTLPSSAFDNIVPGYFAEKCVALLKTLPKHKRKALLPFNETYQRLSDQLGVSQGSLLQRLEQAIFKCYELRIERDDWREDKLPAHLFASINVLAEDNGEQKGKSVKAVSQAAPVMRPDNENYFYLDGFDGREVSVDSYPLIEESYTYQRGGLDYKAYPGLVVSNSVVRLCLYHDVQLAKLSSAQAAAQVVVAALRGPLNSLKKRLFNVNKQRLHLSVVPDREAFVDDCAMRICVEASGIFDAAPTSQQTLNSALSTGKQRLGQVEQDYAALLTTIVGEYYALITTLQGVNKSQHSRLVNDVISQHEALLYKGFMMRIPTAWLRHYPRFLQAATYRCERVRQQGGRDSQLQDKLDVWLQRMQALSTGPKQQQLFWMVQEYRVSLFAQRLKTSIPVSETRLQQAWQQALD